MTFAPDNSSLWKHPDYIAARDRLSAASAALESLEDAMFIFKTEPLDLEKIEDRKTQVTAAKQARREVLLRLLAEHLKGGLHLEPK